MLASAGESSCSFAMKSAGSVKSTGVVEVVAIDEDAAVGNVGVVVVNDAVVMPVISPVVPTPTKASVEANSKAQAKCNSGARKKQSWIRIPARPDSDWLSVYEPRVILRHVNDFRIGWCNHDRLALLAD